MAGCNSDTSCQNMLMVAIYERCLSLNIHTVYTQQYSITVRAPPPGNILITTIIIIIIIIVIATTIIMMNITIIIIVITTTIIIIIINSVL